MEDKIVESIEDYIKEILRIGKESKGSFFYRGQSNKEFELKPSILRKDMDGKEDKIYLKVLSECSNEFDVNMTHIDILSKMQHYEVPTRLLDVTTNALVALYFACDDKDNEKKDGCVYVFNVDEKSIKQFDSDTISILSSLPRFNDNDKKKLALYAEREDEIGAFNEHDVVKRLLHEIKKEKPAFENIIDPKHLLRNYFLLPKKDNPRIIRQSGAFVIYGLGDSKLCINNEIIISGKDKDTILEELKYMGISKASLHPELYKRAEYIKDCIKRNIDF